MCVSSHPQSQCQYQHQFDPAAAAAGAERERERERRCLCVCLSVCLTGDACLLQRIPPLPVLFLSAAPPCGGSLALVSQTEILSPRIPVLLTTQGETNCFARTQTLSSPSEPVSSFKFNCKFPSKLTTSPFALSFWHTLRTHTTRPTFAKQIALARHFKSTIHLVTQQKQQPPPPPDNNSWW